MPHFIVQLCLVRWQQVMLHWWIKTLPQRITTSAMRQGLWECKVNDFLNPKKCFVMFHQNSWLSRSSCSSSYPRELSHSVCALPQRWVALIKPHSFCAAYVKLKCLLKPTVNKLQKVQKCSHMINRYLPFYYLSCLKKFPAYKVWKFLDTMNFSLTRYILYWSFDMFLFVSLLSIQSDEIML